MSKKKEQTKGQYIKRQLIEVGVIAVVFGFLYFTGLHTEVIGTLQRGLLATGIIQPAATIDEDEVVDAVYNVQLYTMDGHRTTLAELEGKTVFMNFWATWCPPCIAELPNINDLHASLADSESVAFVMLSLDEDPEKARLFMEKKGYDLPVYFPASRLPGVYNASTIPTTYVISPQGQIVMEKQGMANYNTDRFKEFLLGL